MFRKDSDGELAESIVNCGDEIEIGVVRMGMVIRLQHINYPLIVTRYF